MFFLYPHHLRAALWVILGVHIVLAWWGIRTMGVLGYPAWLWMDGAPTIDALNPGEAHRFGPFLAACGRPIESLRLGSLQLPIAVTPFIGGAAEWPGRILSATGAHHDATMMLHLGMSAMLIGLVHRFVRIHGSAIAANAAATLLATDWTHVFLRRALGGSELVLSASGLLCLWALWGRRWGGGRPGLAGLALGFGVGIATNITFALTAVALAATAAIMRWDKPPLRPPLPSRWLPIGLAFIVPLLPLLGAAVHRTLAGVDALCSGPFDEWPLVLGMTGLPIEASRRSAVIMAWLGDGTAALGTVWAASAPSWVSPLRFAGWIVVALGTWVAWQDTDKTPRFALTRFCSVFVPLQVSLIALAAPDLHHLSIATVALMIWAGLATEAVFGWFAPPRSARRAVAVFVGCLPWVLAGVWSIRSTDAILATVSSPTVAVDGQSRLVRLIERNSPERVVTLNHASAGMLDVHLPGVEFQHAWAGISDDPSALDGAVGAAVGAHLLRAPDPTSVTLRESDLERAAARVGAELVAVDRLPDDAAVLYAVGSRTGLP